MNRSASTAPSQTSSFHEVVWASEASPRQGRNTAYENDKIHHCSTPPPIPSSSDLHGKLAHLVSHRLSPSSNEVNGSSEATPGRQRKNDKIHHFSTPPPIPSSSKLHGKMPLCLMSGFISTPNVNPNPPSSLYCPPSSSTASSSKDFLIALQKVSPRQHENDNTDHFSTPPTPPPTPTIFRSSELHGKQTHRVGHRLSPSTLTASSSNAVNGSSEATPGRQHLKKTFRSSELHGKQTPQGWDAINTYYNCTGWCSRTMIHVGPDDKRRHVCVTTMIRCLTQRQRDKRKWVTLGCEWWCGKYLPPHAVQYVYIGRCMYILDDVQKSHTFRHKNCSFFLFKFPHSSVKKKIRKTKSKRFYANEKRSWKKNAFLYWGFHIFPYLFFVVSNI